MSETDTKEHSPTTPAGEIYLDAVLESLQEAVDEYNAGGEELPINTNCLCVDFMTEPDLFEHWVLDENDEETGEVQMQETGNDLVTGHKFVVTTGGPHAEFQTKDGGRTWSFFYCDWFGSDAFTYHFGTTSNLLDEAFGLWFECGLEEGSQLGALI
tara:strand:- start:177 stop:644 length:468 start_codon:yes stop_codon:yes gene_type:complete